LNIQINCRRIVGGSGSGKALVTKQPINFLAMIDTKKYIIKDRNHELYGKSIKDAILVFPHAIGSSVGAYAIYSLKVNGVAPRAVICSNKADIITASGCAISNIPLVDTSEKVSSSDIITGLEIIVDADNKKIIIQTV
jgi:predicted aconitase with swiveling domain